jgi:hypothetical protein
VVPDYYIANQTAVATEVLYTSWRNLPEPFQFSNGFRSDLEELGSAKEDHAFVVNPSESYSGI